MFLTDADVREAADPREAAPRLSMVAVVAGTAVKTVLAALAGLVLSCGLGLLIWAVTPSSGSGPLPLVRAGISAFCAANGMTLDIGRSGLTLHPLMLTLVAVALLTTISGRGRVVARGREQEVVAAGTSALIYALAVAGIGAGFGGGTVSAAQWWRPAMLAFVVVAITTLIRGDGWRVFLLDRLPIWVPVSLRCGGAAMAALLGGGAVTLVIGLVRTFGDSTTVQTLAAPGAAGGLGMALLGIAYLPNAVVAATGYSTGVGFTIGSGTYTPFGSSPVELPAVSLLAAAPDGHAFARTTLLLLLFPVLAAVLIGRGVVRRLDTRNDRLFAAGGAALIAAVLSVVIAEAAAGGVTGGEWSTTGVPPALFGSVVLALLGVISAAMVVLTRVPALAAGSSADTGADDGPDEAGTGPVDEVVDEVVGEVTDEVVEESEIGEPEIAGDEIGEPEIAGDEIGEPETAGHESADLDDAVADDGQVSDTSQSDETVSDPDEREEPAAVDETETETEAGDDTDNDEIGADAAPAAADPSVHATDQVAAPGPAAKVTPAIPSPREEDVIAVELAADDDPDVKLLSDLSRKAEPRRIG